jgi:hypothetical protein
MYIKTLRLLGLASILALSGTLVAAAPATQPDRYTGNLVNTLATARSTRPFVLAVDHYSTDGELGHVADVLTSKGPYAARDELWKNVSGNLSIGGGIGYPVGPVVLRQTPTGRQLLVVIDRPMSLFETQYYTRSSRYPVALLTLDLDGQGRGNGTLIAAARMQARGDQLSFESLGPQPLRLLDVKEQ